MPNFDDLPKAYDASHVEDSIYAAWEQSGVFNPDKLPERNQKGEPYCIVMPPPNRTGTLHMGHATMLAIEDLLIRFQRMQGKRTLWIPGTDHAAIATQVRVEQLLIKQGMKDPRKELGREKLLEKVIEFAEGSKRTINNQVRKMGSSCDWSRERYTFDTPRNIAVNRVFKMMFDDGVIERGYRIVNWDPQFQTTLSDDEVLSKEITGKLLTFTYDKDFPIAISTTRPETKFGDVAVAVHPEDERYASYVGQTFAPTFCGKRLSIKVIADAAVDPAFGTGALGVTPAHSMIDAEMAERHALETIQVIGQDGRMLPIVGEEFAGLTITEVRAKIEAALKEGGLLQKVEEVQQHLPIAERGGAPVEQLPMRQWFIRVNKPFALRQDTLNKWKKGDFVSLKELMIHAVESGQTTIVPDRFDKTYFHWINNLRDWCISRQIWFGHRIPVWYRGDEVVCSTTPMGEGWEQDPDTLDTWFSAGSWTFSALGWPLTTLVYMRHGKARSNVEQFVDGGSKGDGNSLTEEGVEQVKRVTDELRRLGATRIVSSPIHRARQTSEIVASALGIPIEYDDRLCEVGLGKHDGATEEKFASVRGPIDAWRGGAEVPDEIESYASVSARMQAVASDIVRKYAGETVLVISHGDPLNVYFDAHDGSNVWGADYPRNAEPHVIRLDSSANVAGDLDLYHPTNVLETGYDILFFWVARMILMSSYVLGEVPFKDVYLHGLVRDEEGRKMSKSLGNILDPLDLIPKYGTDAVRLSLVMGTTPGQDTKLSEAKIEGFRNFTNKLWNISRFVLMQIGETEGSSTIEPKTMADRWILARLNDVTRSITKKLETYQLSAAAEELRDFTWNDFADWYLEIAKIEKGKETILAHILKSVLAMWHPFMPFVTEYVWGLAGWSNMSLIVSDWPKASFVGSEGDVTAAASFEQIRQLITDIRRLRSDLKIEPKARMPFFISSDEQNMQRVHENATVIAESIRAGSIDYSVSKEHEQLWSFAVSGPYSIGVFMTIDADKEREKLAKEIAETQAYVTSMEQKLSNEEFTSKAPAKVVDGMKAKRDEAVAKAATLTERLKSL